jgi:hypothetical protein
MPDGKRKRKPALAKSKVGNVYSNRHMSKMIERAEMMFSEIIPEDIGILNITDVIGAMVEAAERILPAEQSGHVKHQLVRDAFNSLDKKYKLIDKLDDLITLPWFAEPFDGPLLRAVIDILITQAVSALNRTVWKK